ncbi:hypothetical protein WT75_10180 [Burkholderia stagnalis]|nr:hypothetical protein WT75_10180 [Burkholderia stagnalis]KWK61298.1 hypothetical protein WT82_27030 [Burkholderia stagnalis]KWN18775.1 hypothetical protein WT84_14395 [Burkholderia stagnalis]KWN33672.1 hypothetical protein WT85_10260 [Burkholderia stagnalis]
MLRMRDAQVAPPLAAVDVDVEVEVDVDVDVDVDRQDVRRVVGQDRREPCLERRRLPEIAANRLPAAR